MRKIACAVLILTVCVSFFACSKKAEVTETSTTEITTTTKPEEKTTALPSENQEQGEKLKKAVLNSIENSSNASVSGELKFGKFTYSLNRNPAVIYANERSQEFEDKAYENAEKLVKGIKGFYGDEITFDRMYPYEIDGGNNGVDSVRYEFYYLNSQNQQLTIYADSDGVISYAECNFTW